ncbi:unnamed protein product [Dibothriocephalus latus]|uniref:TIMELESS-interacting protein n=1 Tax=Dibothriocephalus latus TaxID=60516 RepID=A0A3P7M4L5_DIBLA|nr:unnamed protein product [Dibothriocephalus latus]
MFEDLNRLLFLYESWANRLLPKFSFQEIVERLEVVGTKREVHNTLQRMRAGVWPVSAISEEFVDEREDGDSSGGEADEDVMRAAMADVLAENVQPRIPPAAMTMEITNEVTRTPQVDVQPPLPRENSSPPRPSTSTAVHTDEESIQERIELNRRLAVERLEAKRRSTIYSEERSGKPGTGEQPLRSPSPPLCP